MNEELAHQQEMQYCLQLAEIALKRGDPPVGATLVLDGKRIGEGIEAGKTSGDITRHAEIEAIKDALSQGHSEALSRASLYTSHEPCWMCSYFIRHHKIAQIIYGVSVEHIGGHSSKFAILAHEEVPKWGQAPQIITGVLEAECEDLNRRFQVSLKQAK